MKQFETRFKQVDVFPMVKHYMDELDLYNLFKKYVPAAPDSLAKRRRGQIFRIKKKGSDL